MNKQTIEMAITALKEALAAIEDDEAVVLNFTLTKQELHVLRLICTLDLSVPDTVAGYYKTIAAGDVKLLLNKLMDVIDDQT